LPQLPQPARKKKTVRYALIRRGDKVLLTQRPADAAQMPGLWELPEYEGAAAPAKGAAHAKKPAAAHRVTVSQEPGTVLLRLRHSITETDYAVEVLAAEASQRRSASAWFDEAGWRALPLTGLARKILRRL
jgi:A/G-specific adenine glycosylase